MISKLNQQHSFITKQMYAQCTISQSFSRDYETVTNANFWKFQKFDADVKIFVMTNDD